MSWFLDWYNDPDVAEDRREIQRHLRCTDAEAVLIQQMRGIADQVESLEAATEWAAIEEMDPDEGDEDEPLGI